MPAVQGSASGQVYHDLKGPLRRAGPVEDLLAQQHAEVVVDDALLAPLHLGSVPQRVEVLPALELLQRLGVGRGSFAYSSRHVMAQLTF